MRISLKAARVNAGITQDELAKLVGVTRQTIMAWEDNPASMKIKDAEKVCETLGVPFDQIFFGKKSTKY